MSRSKPLRAAVTGVGLFSMSFGLTMALGFLQLTVLVRVLGLDAWGDVAVAQAFGALIATFASLGWPAVGPAAVATLDDAAAARLFRDSLPMRAYAVAVGVGLVLVTLPWWSSAPSAALGLVAVAVGLNALSSAWFFIGRRAPLRLLLLETVPACLGIGTGLLLVHRGLAAYATCVAVGAAVAVGLGIRGATASGRASAPWSWHPGSTLKLVRGHRSAIVAAWGGHFNVNAPLILVGMGAGNVAAFAVVDRYVRYALAALTPLQQHLQGWLPSADRSQTLASGRRLTLVSMPVGLLTAGVLFVAGPSAVSLISGGQATPTTAILLPFALAGGTLFVGTVTSSLVLLPLGRVRTVAWSTVVGALVIVASAVGPTPLAADTAVAWGVALGEGVAVSWQVVAVLRAREDQAARE